MPGDKLLFLGPENSPLLAWLKEQGNVVFPTSERLSVDFVDEHPFDFLVSYGYRHILSADVLDRFPNAAINLHISFLPWNRGADPNFWSFVEDTPKGVTIHYLDEGVDTGDIIVQRQVRFESSSETLATSYAKLQQEIQELFKTHWHSIRTGTCRRQKQSGLGSIHKQKDKQRLAHLLTDGWDTPVSVLEAYAGGVGGNSITGSDA